MLKLPIKVGKVPLIKALIRCIVVVGGSAMNLKSFELPGAFSSRFSIVGIPKSVFFFEKMKSKRSASTNSTIVLSNCLRLIKVWVFVSFKERRLIRKPLLNMNTETTIFPIKIENKARIFINFISKMCKK